MLRELWMKSAWAPSPLLPVKGADHILLLEGQEDAVSIPSPADCPRVCLSGASHCSAFSSAAFSVPFYPTTWKLSIPLCFLFKCNTPIVGHLIGSLRPAPTVDI